MPAFFRKRSLIAATVLFAASSVVKAGGYQAGPVDCEQIEPSAPWSFWSLPPASSFPTMIENSMLRAAVERKFQIVGEALSKLPKADSAIASRIGEHARLAND